MDFHPQPKGRTRKQIKGRKQRHAAKVVKGVRAQCVERDLGCRLCDWEQNPDDWHSDDLADVDLGGLSVDISEWAHMHVKRRSQTRGLPPEIRHTTKDSLMLCRFHHQEYDAHRLFITALTRRGADGPLRFRRAK